MGQITDDGYRAIWTQLGVPQDRLEDAVTFSHAWQKAEGGQAENNPFNTTLNIAPNVPYNSFGPDGEYHVRSYGDLATGIEATVTTLQAAPYADIIHAVRDGDLEAAARAVGASPWGTNGQDIISALGGGSSAPGPANPNPGNQPTTTGGFDVATLPTLQLGSKDDTVITLKALLTGWGHGDNMDVQSENFDQQTEDAVKGFQGARQVTADGVVGPVTWAKLARV